MVFKLCGSNVFEIAVSNEQFSLAYATGSTVREFGVIMRFLL